MTESVNKRVGPARVVSVILWSITMLTVVFAMIDYVLGMHSAQTAPQQAVVAAGTCAIAILPYVFARAWDAVTDR